MLSILNNEDISTLDRQIEQLIDFKPIPEHEVKILCEKVFSMVHFNKCTLGEGNSLKRVKRVRCALSSHCVR